MKYFFEVEYIEEGTYISSEIIPTVAQFFFKCGEYCEFESINLADNTKYSFSGTYSEGDLKKIISTLESGSEILKLIISSRIIKDDDYSFALYDSIHNWSIELDKTDYEEFIKWLKSNRLPEDLFFAESEWVKEIVNNPIDRFLSWLGFPSETSRFYTPRQIQKRSNSS
jgi:hypothetical protein